MKTLEKNKIEFTRINNDVNGNPRYVFHFLALLNEGDRIKQNHSRSDIFGVSHGYQLALNKARSIGGRKFHNKQYGGGIVFQSYNTPDEQTAIDNIKEVNIKFLKEWTPKQFKQVKKAIYNHFIAYKYQVLAKHGEPARDFNPCNFEAIDNLLGLAYTSTGMYAAEWVCSGGYLMANDTHHFIGFAINELNQVVAIVEDEEENAIYIEL